jgi:hypothetical protein
MSKINDQFGIAYALENLPHRRHIAHKGKHIDHLPKPYVKSMFLGYSYTTWFLLYHRFNKQ